MLAEDQLRRLRKGARIVFVHMYGHFVEAQVDQKLGDRLACTDRARNQHAVCLEDVVGVLSSRYTKNHPWVPGK